MNLKTPKTPEASPFLQKRFREECQAIPSRVDPPVESGDTVALLVASTIAGAAIDAVAPGTGFAFGLFMNFVGEPRPSTEVLKPDLQEAVLKDFFRRRPIQAFVPKTRDIAAWNAFLQEHWEALQGHGHIPVPRGLAKPEVVGFLPTRLAAHVGQETDWVLPLPDRSRLHVHGFKGGRFEVHRDTLDPARGPIVALWHWFTETPEGQLTAGAGATVALAWWVFRDERTP